MRNKYQQRAFERFGLICENYFGLQLSINEIADKLQIHPSIVNYGLAKYFKKPSISVTLQSKINATNLVCSDVNRSTIIDYQTGIYYSNAADLARALNKPHRTICHYLNGERKQKDKRFEKV